jgi:hypothetical protein
MRLQFVAGEGGIPRRGVPACPGGGALAGVRFDTRELLCRQLPWADPDEEYEETENRNIGILTCKAGYYAVGASQSKLICEHSREIDVGVPAAEPKPGVAPAEHTYGAGTKRTMHICPQTREGPAMVVVGMNEDASEYLCAP